MDRGGTAVGGGGFTLFFNLKMKPYRKRLQSLPHGSVTAAFLRSSAGTVPPYRWGGWVGGVRLGVKQENKHGGQSADEKLVLLMN